MTRILEDELVIDRLNPINAEHPLNKGLRRQWLRKPSTTFYIDSVEMTHANGTDTCEWSRQFTAAEVVSLYANGGDCRKAEIGACDKHVFTDPSGSIEFDGTDDFKHLDKD